MGVPAWIAAGARAALVAGVAAAAIAPGHATATPHRPDVAQVATAVVEKANDLRREHGLQAVRSESRLVRTAAGFAAHMADTDRYGHESDGRTPAQRVQASGYEICSVAENIAFLYHSAGFETAALAGGLFRGWRDSPPHRRNMLMPEVTDTGVAVARSARSGRYYAVQLFARPAALRIRFAVVNRSAQVIDYALDGARHALSPGATRTHSQCAPGDLALSLAGEAAPLRVQAGDGARYVVGGGPGRWRLDETP